MTIWRLVRSGIVEGHREIADPGGGIWFRQDLPQKGGSGNALGLEVRVAPAAVQTFSVHPVRFRRGRDGGLPAVAASGFEGLESLSIKLPPTAGTKPRLKVRLHFAEPRELGPGRRPFSVSLQGREVLKDFDVVVAAGGPLRAVAREFRNVEADGQLHIELKAATRHGPALLCGIELVRE